MKKGQIAGIFLRPISLKIIPTRTKEKEWRKKKELGGRKEEKRKQQRLYCYIFITPILQILELLSGKKNKHLFERRGLFEEKIEGL